MAGLVTPADDYTLAFRLAEPAESESVEAAVREEARRPFDLAAEHLLRAAVFPAKGGGEATLVINIHHAVGDAWSSMVVLEELAALYSAGVEGRALATALPPLPVQYADFVLWQQRQLGGDGGEALREHWRAALRGVPGMLQLPADRPRPAAPTFEAGTVHAELGLDLMQRLGALASGLDINLQAVLLAGLQVVLSRYSGQEDVAVGVPTAGRDLPEVQPLIGYFINTVAVRGQPTKELPFASMAEQASVAMLEAQAHAHLPFADVVKACGVKRVPGVNPIFQARRSRWLSVAACGGLLPI